MQFLPRSVFVFVFCIPLAIVLGFMLATPLDSTSLSVIGVVFLLLLFPVMLVKHHAFLIVSINAFVNIYFLPGQPQLWLITAVISCFFAVLTWTLNRGKIELINIPSLTLSLIFLFVVTLITAKLTGGVGSRALGSGLFGGRKYYYIWAAIMTYFAVSAFPISDRKRTLCASLFFLSGITSIVGNLAYTLGPNFYFLYLLFPSDFVFFQAMGDDLRVMKRVNGLSPAAISVITFMFLRYGLQGIFQLRHFWRPVIVAVAIVLGSFSGYRSLILMIATYFVVQFFLEGLHKTRYLAVALVTIVLAGTVVFLTSNRLPLPVQRCLTVLPLKLDPAAVEDARGSTMWRIEIWRTLLPDVPTYFWLGKGFIIDPKDLYFAQEGLRLAGTTDGAIVAGDYHNGPLTLIIPLGIWGVIAFAWFVIASLRVPGVIIKTASPHCKK